MSNLIAKKYVKALLKDTDNTSILKLAKNLAEISKAFKNEKFDAIISSIEVDDKSKLEFIISLIQKDDNILLNLLKLLSEKRRLVIIPQISKELELQLAILNNKYEGIVFTNKELSSKYISSIEKQFSKKFNVDLSLSQNICDYDGIKVDIDALGVEIAFSKDRLKTQMINHILKAV